MKDSNENVGKKMWKNKIAENVKRSVIVERKNKS